MPLMKYPLLSLLLFACLLSPHLSHAAENPPQGGAVGTIIHIMGYASAAQPGQDERQLELQSPIYKMDKIVTGRTGNLEIRFKDDSVYSQAKESSATIDDFIWSENKSTSKMLLKLSTGAARYVTGKIVQTNPDAFAMETPLTSIGIRGTEVFANVTPTEEQIGVLSMTAGHTVTVTSGQRTVTLPTLGLMTVVKPDRTMSPAQPIPAKMREKVIREAPMTSQGEPGKYGNLDELEKKAAGFDALVNENKRRIGPLGAHPDYRTFRTLADQERGRDNAHSERDGTVSPSSSLGGNSNNDNDSNNDSGGYSSGYE